MQPRWHLLFSFHLFLYLRFISFLFLNEISLLRFVCLFIPSSILSFRLPSAPPSHIKHFYFLHSINMELNSKTYVYDWIKFDLHLLLKIILFNNSKIFIIFFCLQMKTLYALTKYDLIIYWK